MIAFPLAAALILLALPGWSHGPGRRIHPRHWARAAGLALMAGAATLEGTLVLVAGPTWLRALGAPGMATLCERVVETMVPGGLAVGWPAGGASVLLAVAAGWGVRRARAVERTVRVEPWLGVHHDRGDHDLVVLPTGDLVALSLPGQVVVSEGLVEALSPAQLAAVLGHEEAHLCHRHGRYLLMGAALEGTLGFLPFVRRSAAVLRLALERWADEEAAGVAPGGRVTVGEALEVVMGTTLSSSLAAFGAAETVVERHRALAGSVPSPGGRGFLAYAPVVTLVLAVLASWGAWLGSAGSALAAGSLCLV